MANPVGDGVVQGVTEMVGNTRAYFGSRSSSSATRSASAFGLVEFQRNLAFIVIVILIGSATGIYVAVSLRSVLVPLVWACFFALPLERLATHVNDGLISVTSLCMRPFRIFDDELRVVTFRHVLGRNTIRIQNTTAARCLIRLVDNPFSGYECRCCCPQRVVNFRTRTSSLATIPPESVGRRFRWKGPLRLKTCQRRVRITKLQLVGHGTDVGNPLVSKHNQLLLNCNYYLVETSRTHDELECALFLDRGCREFPAVVEAAEDGAASPIEVVGTFKVDKTSSWSWSISIMIVLSLIILSVTIIGFSGWTAVQTFENNLHNYTKGVHEFIEYLKKYTPSGFFDNLQNDLVKAFEDRLKTNAGVLLTDISSILFQFAMFVIYVLFFLAEPIPVSSPITDVFKSYLFLKTVVCLLFAAMMGGLLYFLKCGLWPVFFIVAFVLNFLPEIGALLVGLLSLPAVLLDGSVESISERVRNTIILISVGVFFKFLTGNVIEVQMYTTRGGEYMRMNSVFLLAAIMVFGELIGITGYFLAVPFTAVMKYMFLSCDAPPSILGPVLCFVEGDIAAAHRKFIAKWGTLCEDVVENHLDSDDSPELTTADDFAEVADSVPNKSSECDIADQSSPSHAVQPLLTSHGAS
eukprot:TRINITY_DN76078_c0_g1_i1.p1 TRINITY_DN76078_c0_g1~~TRINITY_DN76078_c0_g1_i1.p1  ORF type:complete len:637 (-),score=82.25 TRINITY_DN76078_c0_g1_i1:183-2093(-)